ncbi:unnamed protein product [Chrysoparadoxa australica]
MRLRAALTMLAMITRGFSKKVDWNKVDWDALEEQWEEGDEEADLATDQDELRQQIERRRKRGGVQLDVSFSKLKDMSSDEVAAFSASQQQDQAGPAMVFARLKPMTADGEVPAKEETELMAAHFRDLALVGGLKVTTYAVEAGSVLVTTPKGWEAKEVVDFLRQRPEVAKVTWNQQDFPAIHSDEL